MKVAIMQPTYIPWLGYFALMDNVDLFIFLDSVQFSYQSWQHHNQIKTPNGPQKLTIPVLAKSKGRRQQLIREVMIDQQNYHLFPEKHIRAIELNYCKSPYFKKYAPEFFNILRQKHVLLSKLTTELIIWIKEQFGISTKIQYSSNMPQHGHKAELIADLCAQVGATDYYSPQRASAYIGNAENFRTRNITLHYRNFLQFPYPQCHGEFQPYMSAIDLLFNLGQSGLEIIQKGREVNKEINKEESVL